MQYLFSLAYHAKKNVLLDCLFESCRFCFGAVVTVPFCTLELTIALYKSILLLLVGAYGLTLWSLPVMLVREFARANQPFFWAEAKTNKTIRLIQSSPSLT